jgi:hypothetical protein
LFRKTEQTKSEGRALKHHILLLALLASLAACSSGNPFSDAAEAAEEEVVEEELTDEEVEEAAVAAELAGDLDSFTYDPDSETLTITGVQFDDGIFNAVYNRDESSDRVGYEAYTAQDGSLDLHVTAYVRDIRGTQAVVVFSGAQFEEHFSGAGYTNSSYSSPVGSEPAVDGGLVTYAGTYVGLLNVGGSSEDLLDVTAGTPDAVLSNQSAEITGKVLVTGDFADNAVAGIIYEREVADFNSSLQLDIESDDPLQLENVALDATEIDSDGAFTGSATQDDAGVGSYAGIFGGTGATEVAGAIAISNHIDDAQNEIEQGIFVLSQCGQDGAGDICDQPHP